LFFVFQQVQEEEDKKKMFILFFLVIVVQTWQQQTDALVAAPVECNTNTDGVFCNTLTTLEDLFCANVEGYDGRTTRQAIRQLKLAQNPSIGLGCVLGMKTRLRLVSQPTNVLFGTEMVEEVAPPPPPRPDWLPSNVPTPPPPPPKWIERQTQTVVFQIEQPVAPTDQEMSNVEWAYHFDQLESPLKQGLRPACTPRDVRGKQIRLPLNPIDSPHSRNNFITWLPGYCGCAASSTVFKACPLTCVQPRFLPCRSSPLTRASDCYCNCSQSWFQWDCSETCQPACVASQGTCIWYPGHLRPTCLCQAGFVGVDCSVNLAPCLSASSPMASPVAEQQEDLCHGRGLCWPTN